jgi:hypothetical protein
MKICINLSKFKYLKGELFLSESHILGGDESTKEDVDTLSHGEGMGNNTEGRRDTIETTDVVTHVIENTQIMLNNNNVGHIIGHFSNEIGSSESLLDIKIRTRLIIHVDVGLLD